MHSKQKRYIPVMFSSFSLTSLGTHQPIRALKVELKVQSMILIHYTICQIQQNFSHVSLLSHCLCLQDLIWLYTVLNVSLPSLVMFILAHLETVLTQSLRLLHLSSPGQAKSKAKSNYKLEVVGSSVVVTFKSCERHAVCL